MDSYKEYFAKKEAKLHSMSPEKHVEKLEKTRQSMINHVKSGGQVNHARGYQLIDRYNDHATELRTKHPEHWKKYNEKHGSDRSHDGYDFYA
jgi:hypothetical protein